MGALEDLQAAADAASAAQAATQAQIAQLAVQVQAIIDAGAGDIDPAQLQPIVDQLNALTTAETADAAAIDAIVEPDPGETPVEPTP
jgi:predicted oxidoreductase